MQGLARLERLYLVRSPITDAGLGHLDGLGLLELDLRGTKVTAGGLEEFRERHPLCEIHR